MTRSKPKSPLVLSVSRMPKSGQEIEFEMDDVDRRAIAHDLGLVDLPHFSGRLDATPWQNAGVRVAGRLDARANQESVVTLDPVERSYAIDFDMIFVPDTSKLARPTRADEQQLFVDPEGDDPPETFSGEEIDLTPFVTEHLSLELDPYPREAGEEFEEVDTDPEPEAGKVSPFADLAALKKQQDTDK